MCSHTNSLRRRVMIVIPVSSTGLSFSPCGTRLRLVLGLCLELAEGNMRDAVRGFIRCVREARTQTAGHLREESRISRHASEGIIASMCAA